MGTKLFIIGNGFDLYTGVDSQFDAFRQFYYSNQKRIISDLGLSSHGVNHGKLITDLEWVFGDPFNCFELTSSFWNEFENNLAKLSFVTINSRFADSPEGTIVLAKTLVNSKLILDYAIEKWVQSLVLPDAINDYSFDDDCYFINFNYTDTLTEVYEVDPNHVFHIHGSAASGDEIIYGHSMHAHHAPAHLKDLGYIRQFIVGCARYQYDKHALQNYLRLLSYLRLSGVDFHNIERITVLGHSFNAADSFYFLLLSNSILDKHHKTNQYTVSRKHAGEYVDFSCEFELFYDDILSGRRGFSEYESQLVNMLAFEEIGTFAEEDIFLRSKEYDDSLRQRYLFSGRINKQRRRIYPHWNISYYREEEKELFGRLIRELGWSKTQYSLFNSIDDCLCDFKR